MYESYVRHECTRGEYHLPTRIGGIAQDSGAAIVGTFVSLKLNKHDNSSNRKSRTQICKNTGVIGKPQSFCRSLFPYLLAKLTRRNKARRLSRFTYVVYAEASIVG